MAKVLKNYKPTSERVEEFPIVVIRYDDEVFLELPLCAIDYGRVYEKPVLIRESNKISSIMEANEIPQMLANTKLFFLKILEDSHVKEVPEKESDVFIRLPLDTNVKELVFMEGQILREEITEVIEDGTV